MNRLLSNLITAGAVIFAFAATPALALSPTTAVSMTGDDANNCSLFAPCRTFAAAFAQTGVDGTIFVLDSGEFGGATITHGVTIDATGVVGSIFSGVNPGLVINAGPTGRVVLRGLHIFNGNFVGASVGIRITSGFDVLIEDSIIRSNRHDASSSGILVDGTGLTRVTIRNSTIDSNTIGVRVINGGNLHVKVIDSLILDNTNGGLSVDGAGNDIEIVGNRIFGPLGLIQTNGGIVRSYGGNVIPSAASPAQTAATK